MLCDCTVELFEVPLKVAIIDDPFSTWDPQPTDKAKFSMIAMAHLCTSTLSSLVTRFRISCPIPTISVISTFPRLQAIGGFAVFRFFDFDILRTLRPQLTPLAFRVDYVARGRKIRVLTGLRSFSTSRSRLLSGKTIVYVCISERSSNGQAFSPTTRTHLACRHKVLHNSLAMIHSVCRHRHLTSQALSL